MECDYCGQEFTPRQASSRFCCKAHRQASYRERRAPLTGSAAITVRVGDDPAEVLRRLYFTKLDDLERIGWSTPAERERESLDYACSYLPSCRIGPMPDGGIAELERDLLDELGLDAHAAPARTAEERLQMGREWQRIALCMHDPRISGMLRALTDQCDDPEMPTDAEGERAREALIAEIDALGIEPRPFALQGMGREGVT